MACLAVSEAAGLAGSAAQAQTRVAAERAGTIAAIAQIDGGLSSGTTGREGRNGAQILQIGTDNALAVVQDGHDNQARIAVRGSRNGPQDGRSAGVLAQQGLGNRADIAVSGDKNGFIVVQQGQGQSARLDQRSAAGAVAGNAAAIRQQGAQNAVAASQTAWSGPAAPGAGGNRLDLRQSGRGNRIDAVQAGRSNDGTVLQSGSDNTALLEQTGERNASQIVQSGVGLLAISIQTGLMADPVSISQTRTGAPPVIVTRQGPR